MKGKIRNERNNDGKRKGNGETFQIADFGLEIAEYKNPDKNKEMEKTRKSADILNWR